MVNPEHREPDAVPQISQDPSYKYTTPTGSILYSEVLSPYVYSVIVEIYPRWLHPNVITLMGFLCTVGTTVVISQFSREFNGECEKPYYLLMALLFTGYIVFDNTDGKQARRTKTSSNAGEVFDHGVDMTVATLSMLMCSDAMQMGYKYTMICVAASQLATFMNNWYHSVTGVMSWGGRYFSVDEATAVTMLTALVAGIKGPAFYEHKLFDLPQLELVGLDTDVKIGTGVVLATAGYALFDTVLKLFITSAAALDKGTFPDAVKNFLPFLIYCCLFWVNASSCLVEKDGFNFILATGIVFSQTGTQLIFATKFSEGWPAIIQTTATVSMLLIYSCLGPLSQLPKHQPDFCAAEDGSIAGRALVILVGIHFIAFVNGLVTVSDGQPLFAMVKKQD